MLNVNEVLSLLQTGVIIVASLLIAPFAIAGLRSLYRLWKVGRTGYVYYKGD